MQPLFQTTLTRTNSQPDILDQMTNQFAIGRTLLKKPPALLVNPPLPNQMPDASLNIPRTSFMFFA
jgi:hypothetical protein